jgi:leucyl aminopeptidase (aminopeptidase T)
MSTNELQGPARRAADCLGVAAGERVAILHNPPQARIAAALEAAVRERGATPVVVAFDELARHGEEPPADVAAAMTDADAAFGVTTYSLSHTPARRRATDAGVRFASLPGITEDVFGRALLADVATLSADGDALAAQLTAAETCRISCAHGSDLTLSVAGRDGRNDDGVLSARGAFGNLPAGEAYVAPVEDAGTGVLVFDGSLAGYGLLGEPLRVHLRDGAIVEAEGPAAGWLLETLDGGGPNGRHVAELGIGTNPAARIIGTVLEDEKVRGTIHVAFGASSGIGGVNDAGVHLDAIMRAPTLRIGPRIVCAGGVVEPHGRPA